jgi:hypothetical protein
MIMDPMFKVESISLEAYVSQSVTSTLRRCYCLTIATSEDGNPRE